MAVFGRRKSMGRWFTGSAVVLLASAALGQSYEPALTSDQMETDWERQDVCREQPDGGGPVTVEEDAAGGCDGEKTGKWGFHTQNEDQPWWQVDLQESVAIDRVVLFNRCDQCAARNNRIRLLLSEDGKSFEQTYQHDGTVFYGHTDSKPLVISLGGQRARFLRLQLPGRSYFHLDEVEVYGSGSSTNIALGRPATQSSVSQWSVRHGKPRAPKRVFFTDRHIDRGLRLAADLKDLGADVEPLAAELEKLDREWQALPEDAPVPQRRELDHRARTIVRRLSLANPLLDFDEILFIKRAPGMFPHMSDQYYGWWSRGGGGIYLLSGFKTDQPRLRCLTQDWPEGSFLRPELSYDGKRVLFAWCRHYPDLSKHRNKVNKDELPEDAFYHIFEMNLDGSGHRQLTFGRYDDFDARYLPSGDIVFLSTRKGTALQVSAASAEATRRQTCPDSYVRCGGDAHRPVAVFTLHVMNSEGADLRPISAFENFEWTPFVASDGRILYARWDYIDRFNGPFISLWATNPDGTNAQLVYGNYTSRPQCVFEARPVPGSHKLIFTASAHHSITGGSLALLDPTKGTEFERPLTRLTPEVPFPETEAWSDSYYAGPYPLSEKYYLVAWSDKPLPKHRLMPPDDPNNPRNALGIYLYDAFGNLTLLHRDPAISSMNPIPVRARQLPPRLPERVAWKGGQEGAFVVQNVYEGLTGIERGAVKRIRIVAVPPKVQPNMNQPVLGVSREDPGKFVLGTVPVESDGSAYFRIPSGIPVFFQAMDAEGLAVQTMRSLTYVLPGERRSCVGCHDARTASPPSGRMPLALAREPSPLEPGPPGSWPLRFDQLVQPVLDAHCIECHRPDGSNAAAAAIDLTAAASYQNLLDAYDGDLKKLAFERDRSEPGHTPARNSRLWKLITTDPLHYEVRLSASDRERLATWMDTYAHRIGSFSPEQERELAALRREMADFLAPGDN